VSAPIAFIIAYALARGTFRGKWLVELIVNLPLVLPPVVTGYLLLVLFGRRGWIGSALETIGIEIAFTWLGASLAAAVVSFPLLARSIRLALEGVDPRLELAARSLGASRLRSILTISLPLARRGVVAGCVLAFARSLSEFGATLMVAGNIEGKTRTIPLAIYSITNRPGGLEASWRLVTISIVLAAGALIVSEYLQRRQAQRWQT
jgi:molybdate transport system permease protein